MSVSCLALTCKMHNEIQSLDFLALHCEDIIQVSSFPLKLAEAFRKISAKLNDDCPEDFRSSRRTVVGLWLRSAHLAQTEDAVTDWMTRQYGEAYSPYDVAENFEQICIDTFVLSRMPSERI